MIKAKKGECIVDEVHEVKKEAPKEITLYLSILKRENFELAVQKATECGIGRIVPLLTEHTVKTGLKMDRLMKIAKEAAEQSGRGKVPLISEPKTFVDAVRDSVRQKNYFFDIGARESFTPKSKEACGIWVGPEGGWGGKERMLAGDRKFIFTSLGPRVLRAETAAIVASFLACGL
jgi:16S rRNA (uracil1498-N3)-methyltransferase